jgi:hypothetical protein
LKPFGLVAVHIFGRSFRQQFSRTYTSWKTETVVKEGEEDDEQKELTQVDPPAGKSEDRIRALEITNREMETKNREMEIRNQEMMIRIRDVEDVLKEHYLNMKLFEDENYKDTPWYKKIAQGGRTLFDHDIFRGRRQKRTMTQEDSPA